MNRKHDIDDPRRLLLVRALSVGLFGAGWSGANAITFGVFGSTPRKLPPGQSKGPADAAKTEKKK